MNENKELSVITPEQAQILPALVKEMVGPLVEAMAKLLENNTSALNQLAMAQQTQNDRLEALEKQIRLNTPVTRQQARYLAAAIKERALELLDKARTDDPKAVRKLTGIIKKDVLAYYGITALEEIPKHEYSVAMNNITLWNNIRIVSGIAKEARKREAETENAPMGEIRPSSPDDGLSRFSGVDDQPDHQTVRSPMGK